MIPRAARALAGVMLLLLCTAQARAAEVPTSQPASLSIAFRAPDAIPLDTVRKAFDKALQTARATEKPNSLAGNTQAVAEYQKAQRLVSQFPDLKVHPDVMAAITKKITELQGKIAQQAKTRQAADSTRRHANEARAIAAANRGGSTGAAGGTWGGGSVSAGNAGRTGAACPPGAVRSGST